MSIDIRYDPLAWENAKDKTPYVGPFKWHAYRESLVSWIVSLQPTSLLDVGCAGGQYIGRLRERAWQGKYHGVDITPSFIEGARKNHPRERFEVGDVRRLGCKAREYEFVLCSHVLDHLLEISRPIHELFDAAERWVALSVLGDVRAGRITADGTLFNRYFTVEHIMLSAPSNWHLKEFKRFNPEWDSRQYVFQFLFENIAV